MFEAFCVDLSPIPLDRVKARWQNTVRLLANPLLGLRSIQKQLKGIRMMMQDGTPVVVC